MPVNLHALSLLLHLPELVATIPGGFKDLVEPVRLPGCVPIPGPDIIPPLHDRSGPGFQGIVHLAERCREVDTILVNTFDAVEPEVAKLLRQPEPGRPPVYPIGPLILTNADSNAAPQAIPHAACLDWLDRQPAGSVIFVSFGSAGTLSVEQMPELALGLECSGQRFLWVVQSPSDNGTPSEYYFDAESKKNPISYLPEGFIDRTKEVGLVVPSWAPQAEVLAHNATGGFLTHCRWNSTLESLLNGVPMVAWPLFAEQGQNAVMLAEGVQAAIRVPEKDRETIAVVVRELMEGEGKGSTVRMKLAELQKAAKESICDGGASTIALDEVVLEWAADMNN